MKRKIALVFVILLGFVMQTTVFQALSFGGIAPNLLIIITSSYGMVWLLVLFVDFLWIYSMAMYLVFTP